MSMAMMVAMASRQKRDDGGRRMECGNNRRMEGDYIRPEGNYSMTYDEPEMRRRRDSRGRYMVAEPPVPAIPLADPRKPIIAPEPIIAPKVTPVARYMEDEPPVHMRDRNVVNIRDYQDRRRIGFEPDRMEYDEEDRDMRQDGRRYDPDRPTMHYGMAQNGKMQMGSSSGEEDMHLTREEAEKWVRSMQSEDGKKGGRWKLNEIQQYAGNYGVKEEEVVDFFAALNALYTDYGKVARKYGFDRMEVWSDMAKAFMHDKDAGPSKVKMYYECIAKKDDD